MWHVSTSCRPGLKLSDAELRAVCLRQLRGVGDERQGKIADERGALSYQVRRRLSAAEEQMIPGGACDVRRTAVARERLEAAWRWLPVFLRDFAAAEAGMERV